MLCKETTPNSRNVTSEFDLRGSKSSADTNSLLIIHNSLIELLSLVIICINHGGPAFPLKSTKNDHNDILFI